MNTLMRLFVSRILPPLLITVAASTMAATLDELGTATVKDLYQRYTYETTGCGALKNKPAFECSGIMIRATGHGDYDAWNPSPASLKSGGISFSFLRQDVFSLVYIASGDSTPVNGFIFFPSERITDEQVANGSIRPEPLCYSPVNAYTHFRLGESGCGEFGTMPDKSSPCHLQNIDTAVEWEQMMAELIKTRDIVERKYEACMFNVRDRRDDAAQKAFNEGLQTSAFVRANATEIVKGFRLNNELVLRVWENDIPDKLPIQAFFYANAAGRQYAMHDQENYYKKSGIRVPVIALMDDSDNHGHYSFYYHAEDQIPGS